MVNHVSTSPKNPSFDNLTKKYIWEFLPCKDLFSLLSIDKQNFALIATVLLNKEEKEAYPYQVKLLKHLFQIKNNARRDTLLEMKNGVIPLIQKIKTFSNEAEGEATLYAWNIQVPYQK